MSVTLHIGSDTYRMDVFPVPTVTDSNPSPIDIAISGTHAWFSCEFDKRIYSLPLGATDGTEATAYTVPVPSPAIFRSAVFPGMPTDVTCFEDIDLDAQGNLWITQTGQAYSGAEDHFGRILKFSPSTGEWLAYPLPWNNPGPVAVLVDGARVWATGWYPTGSLMVTRPATWRKEATDPVSRTWPHCGEFGGWARRDASAGAAHMAISPADARLYVANYNAASVTSYDRATGEVQANYPLPAGSVKPWQIVFDPFGGCWVTCDVSREIAKLNPANGLWSVYGTTLYPTEHAHSLAISGGVVWFTAYALNGDAGGRICRRTAAGVMEMSEPLDTLGILKGATGIALDATGRIWVALFGHKAIGRLTKL